MTPDHDTPQTTADSRPAADQVAAVQPDEPQTAAERTAETHAAAEPTARPARRAARNSRAKQQGWAHTARGWLAEVWQGRILSAELFRRNFPFIAASILLILMLIANKFECQSKMLEVMKLKKELENAKTDRINASARYNSMIRESHMKAYVEGMNIDLTSPDQPPYNLTKQ